MPGQDREGGAFFANTRKQNQNHPDYRGELRVSPEVIQALQAQLQKGVQFPVIELSGWKKTASSGNVFISLQGKKPYEKTGGGGGGSTQAGGSPWPPQGQANYGGAPAGGNPFDDEIPF